MQARESGDPRLEALFGVGEAKELGVRPVVRLPRSGPSGWMLAAGALVAAIFLFWVLESRRQSPAEPSTRARAADAAQFVPEPPPLYIPPVPAQSLLAVPAIAPVSQPAPYIMAPQRVRPAPAPAAPPIAYYPEPMPEQQVQPMPQPARTASGPSLVIDATAPGATAAAAQGSGASGRTAAITSGTGAPVGRARSSALANRSNTVPQGTLVPAVLETAFDSTRPGFARAIVSRNVRGFDGKKVLIPRGSRLVGEYSADASPGQNRALITWTRLIRPDGMMIAIDSPAVDTLGRGGVRASVNTHFWQRFGDALMQSTVDIGRTLLNRSAAGSIVVVPGGGQMPAPVAQQSGTIAPTLRVPAATSISIFVARDLEFGSGEAGQ